MILNDREIAELAERGMIDPFINHQMRERNGYKVISFGLSSFGYDIRLGYNYKFPRTDTRWELLDPKLPNDSLWDDVQYQTLPFELPAHSSFLADTVESFNMPEDVIGLCFGKSTYARCFVTPIITPLEPGWRGALTVEVVNNGGLPVIICPGEGIAQIVFFRGEAPLVSYATRGGKYQDQSRGVTLGKA